MGSSVEAKDKRYSPDTWESLAELGEVDRLPENRSGMKEQVEASVQFDFEEESAKSLAGLKCSLGLQQLLPWNLTQSQQKCCLL